MHQLLRCLILIIINTASVRGIIRSPCPKACNCDLEKGEVNCPYGYWNELPNIPARTKQVRIKGGHFGKLQGPLSCRNYSEVTLLELVDNGIMSIDEDAFYCMSKLQILTSDRNRAQNIPNNTFQYVPNLLNFTLSGTQEGMNHILHKLCNLTNLEMLDLSFNYMWLEHGNLECIRYLKDLSHVNLAYSNRIHSLNKTLQPLRNVSVYISLAYCHIWELEYDTFFGFKVTILDLSFNRIKHIQRNTFTHLPNLTRLNLAGNDITGIQEWLGNLNSLLEIDLRLQTNITSERQGILYPDFHTRKILINYQTFKHDFYPISSNLFEGIYNIEKKIFHQLLKLETLYLGYNKITLNKITDLLLDIAHCPLKVLSLSGIPLFTLNNYTFKDFQQNKIIRLYLQKCEIQVILPRTFEYFQDLQELDLSHNEIIKPAGSAFQGLTSLKVLTLHHNHISGMYGKYVGLSNPLSSLDVSYNEIVYMMIEDIPTLMKVDFSHNKGLISLDLKNANSLNSVQLSSTEEISGFGSIVSNDLSDLDLSGNIWLIQLIPTLEFPGLKKLNLSRTLIGLLHSEAPKQIWSNVSQLTNLDISDSKFKTLAPRLFSSLSHLRVLNLSSNQIASIDQTAFQGASSLTELFLHDNNIKYVNFETFVHTPYLRLLSMANNPLVCTCEVLWIAQAAKTHDLVFMHNPDETVCYDLSNVIRIKELNLTLSDCETQWSLLILKPIGIGTSGILALAFLYIAWYYRWHIRYAFFLARAGRGRYEEMCDDHEYLYDAFVAYSIEDLPWVKQQLLPNVDVDYFGFGGFKLCLHHRDWLVGVDIAENIVKSIVESRRTILVLSKDFAASYWCQFELAMAHLKLHAVGQNRSRLMVILLNHVPPKLLNPRIIHILSTKTYLAWPEDPNEHKLFWKTLRKSLRKELLYTTKV